MYEGKYDAWNNVQYLEWTERRGESCVVCWKIIDGNTGETIEYGESFEP